jgi:GNAT superfamily N-acetyltransferase
MADRIINDMMAERAYGSLYSGSFADAKASARANEMSRRLNIDPDLVEAAMPDMMAEDRLRRRTQEIERNAAYARIMANTRLAHSGIDDDQLPKVAERTSNLTSMRELGLGGSILAYGRALLAGGVHRSASGFYGLAEAGARTVGAEGAARWLGGIAASQRAAADRTVTKTDSRVFNDVLMGAESVLPSMGTLVVAALTRNPWAAASIMGGTTAGQTYREGREEGLSHLRALSYGGQQGIIEAGMESIAGGVFAKSVQAGMPFLRTVGRQVGIEVATELPTTLAQSGSRFANVEFGQGRSAEEWAAGLPDELISTAIATVSSAGLMTSGALGATRTIQHFVERDRDRRAATQVDRVMEAAATSETRTANPTDFREALNQLVGDTEASSLYVPVEELEKALEGVEIGNDPFWSQYAAQIEEARALGGDVVISLADAATDLAGTPVWDAIREQVRTRPGGVSITEARERQMPEELQKAADAIAQGLTQASHQATTLRAREVVGNWSQQLGYAGERATVVNRMLTAALVTRFNAENARRTAAGQDPVSLEEFGAGWLPQALRTTQAEFEAGASPTGTTMSAGGTSDTQTITGDQTDGQRRGGNGSRSSRELELLDEPAGSVLGNDEPLEGQPTQLTVPGRGPVEVRPYRVAREAAATYMRRSGRFYAPARQYAEIDVARAKRIAQAFEEVRHDPADPTVAAAYDAMIAETLAQFQVIKATGLQIEFIDGEDPYAASPRLAILDVTENNHLWVFPTEGGFGQGEIADSPMLRPTDEFIDGRRLLVNDVFRIVHDYFGHIKDGHGFRAEGEENAWQSHAAMYSPLARRAMTTETRGQNSWLNFGPYAEHNRTASAKDTVYAPQKVGLMPEWASEEGFLGGLELDQPAEPGYRLVIERDLDDDGTFVFAYSTTEKDLTGGALVIGHLHVPDDRARFASWSAGDVDVSPKHRRKGIATAMYVAMARHMGMAPDNSEIQSADAQAMWSSASFRNAVESFDEQTFDQTTANGRITGYHGTPFHFEEFANGKAVWFADRRELAALYSDPRRFRKLGEGRIIEAELDLGNVLDLEPALAQLPAHQVVPDGAQWALDTFGFNLRAHGWERQGQDYAHAVFRSQAFADAAREAGYDALHVRESGGDTWGMLRPGTIRSPEGMTLNQAVEVPGFENVAPYLSAEELANLREASKRKILDIVEILPSAEETAAVAVAGRAKKGWYARSAQAIVDVFGIADAPRFAALLAALSPQTSVEMNFFNALRVWTFWNNAGRPTDRREIVQIMGEAVSGKRGSGSVLPAWINNSVAALQSTDPGRIELSGPKVNSFMNNLVGVVDEVTNDTWMANYADVDPITFRSIGGKKGPGYKAFNAVVRKAAQIATEKTGVDWSPSEVQEAVWSFARTLYLRRDTAGESQDMQALLDAGQITHEDIAATPDFAVLFADGIFATILEEGGYDTATIGSIGRDAGFDGDTGSVAEAEGTGFDADAFRQFLGQAATRLERVRQRRRADRQANERQPELTFNQSVTPAEEIFYSAAQRAVANSKQEKATAEQWKALLTPGKTPGIKSEEIEWTGIHDWLDMQQGSIEKGALLQVLRDRGIQVEEAVLTSEVDRAALLEPYGYTEADLADPEHEGHLILENPQLRAQFQSWSSDPSNPTYRELLITLPLGQGSNPERAPSTHWDTEAVVAHARFMDKTDAEGKRVLFIEEVQSDWHQKGRDQGYEVQASSEQAMLTKEALEKAEDEARGYHLEFVQLVEKLVEDAATRGYKPPEFNNDQTALPNRRMRAEVIMGEIGDKADPELFQQAYNVLEIVGRSDLRVMELARDYANTRSVKGIPEAPFKSSWPALVMKRMIRWASDAGYDKIAWTTGAEQTERYWGGSTPAQERFAEVTEPPRVREELFEVFGPELASVLPLEVVDAAMLPALQNDKVRQAIVEAIPVDVVNILTRHKLTPEQLARDPNMVGNTLPVVDRAPVARGLASALEFVGTSLRAALNRVPSFEAAGSDGKLYSAIRASDLDPRVIVRLLTTPALGQGATDAREGSTGTGAETGTLARIGSENRSAELAVALNWHGRLVANSTGVATADNYEVSPGEGMKAFYDRNLVNITNDIIKKYGAKVGPVAMGTTGLTAQEEGDLANARRSLAEGEVEGVRRRYLEGTVRELSKREKKLINPGFEITDKLREAASGGFALFQQKRGNISIQPDESGMMRTALIRAFEAADFSTAVHELGHFFLEDLRRRALSTGATDQEIADWETFKAWAAELGQTVTDDSNIPVDAHEFFARGFERFTWEGQSPSIGLRHLFFRLREFMLELYRTATRFNSPITPEIRDVMGRMLASDDEVNEQREQMALVSGQLGELMTEAELQAYNDLAEESRQDARDSLFTRVLSSMRAERSREARQRKDEIRAEVQADVDNQPLFRALKLLRVGQPLPDGSFSRIKLDRQQLTEIYGSDIEGRLPRTVPPIVGNESTLDIDQIAGLTGFTSGDEMIKAFEMHAELQREMKDSGDRRSPRQRAVDDLVDSRYREEVGDPFEDLEEEAQAALANDRQADLISMELRAISRKSGQKPTAWRLAKEWAEKRVRLQTSQEAVSGRAIQMYARNASKAGQRAEEAIIAGKMDEAFAAKQQQLLNLALLSEAKKAKEEVEKASARLRRIAGRPTIPSVDQDYLEQAHQLLEDVDLKTKSMAEVARRMAFEDWYLERVAEGIEPSVPARYRATLGQTHWSKLTIEEFVELDRIVGQIVELGRLKRRLRDGQRQRDFDEGIMEQVGQAETGKERKRGKTTDPERTFGGRVRSRLRGIDAAMIKVEQMVEWLDNGEKNGPWRRMLFQPLADAQAREKDLTTSYVERLNTLIRGMSKEQAKSLDRQVDTPELVIRNPGHSQAGEPFRGTKDQILVMAMNWGNEGNRQRLLDGFGWEEADLLAVFDRVMTKEDWDFVQGVWDLVDELWPEIEQLERRVNGVAPEKVEATEVQTRHGVYRGGYFPVVYDPNESTRADLDEASKLSPNGAWHQVTTRAGSSHGRVARVNNRPVLLNMGVITRHIGEVIHDITHREAVVQARKILSDNRIRAVVNRMFGPEYYRRMGSWLENIATPNISNSKSDPAAISIARHLNKGVSLAGLGFRITTVLVQPLGLSNSISEIGVGRVLEGIRIMASNPRKGYNEIVSRSGEMRARFSTIDATIDDMMAEAQSGKLRAIGPRAFVKYAFHGILYMDMLVTTASWTGAFNKALVEGAAEDDAVAYADSVIRKTQGAGGRKDRSSIMYENDFARSFWPFFSYLNALYNQQRDVFHRGVRVESGRDALEVMRRGWWVFVVPTLLQAMIFGQGPDGDDEDPESWAAYLTKAAMLGNMASIPGVGAIANAIGAGYGYRSNAWQGIGEDIKKGWDDVDKLMDDEGEVKGSTIQKVLTTTGILLAKPLGQPAATARGLYDYARGEAEPETAGDWYNLLTKGRIPDQPTAIQQLTTSEEEAP